VTFSDIIIVNWNSGSQLRACLESIVYSSCEGFVLDRVVVVDNASEDGSADGLEDIDLPLFVMRNWENRGFAAACNQGARGSNADYLLFLNPDARLFRDSLSKSLAHMERPENRGIGILGIQLLNEKGEITRSCARFPTLRQYFSKMIGLDLVLPRFIPGRFMKEWDHKRSMVVDQVVGAFFLVRRSLFKSLGGFDERFFVYYEEVDFSLRAEQKGSSSFYLAEVQAFHRGGGASEGTRANRLFYSLRSRIQYGYKNFDYVSGTVLAIGTLLLEPLTRLVFSVMKLSGSEMRETMRGYVRLWRYFPDLFKV
jgi:N-acetylglucosaminyl-diphospho-decaprenol L-rhamnosyltransferase